MTYSVKAGECLKWDDIVAKNGAGSRLVWRPPRDFRYRVNGTVHSDDRGLFARYLGHKVVFKSKINAAFRVKATIPVGRIREPQTIFARPVVVDQTADPMGTKKDLSRKAGKRGMKGYSKATDRIEINVTEKQLFTGDANLYSLFVEKLPGDHLISPTYYCDGYTLLDYMPILPNKSQFTGEDFNPDMVVCEIVIVVRYIVSRMNQADGAADVIKVNNFYKGFLPNLDSVFHVDVDEWYTQKLASGSVSPGSTMITTCQDEGYPYIGVALRNNKYVLSGYDLDKTAGPSVKILNHEGAINLRLVVPGLSLKSGNGILNSCEFGYDSEIDGWVLFNGKDVVVADESEFVQGEVGMVSSAHPVMLFSAVREGRGILPAAHDGLIRNYGENLTMALTWDQFAQGLAIVVKVLQLTLQIGGMVFA